MEERERGGGGVSGGRRFSGVMCGGGRRRSVVRGGRRRIECMDEREMRRKLERKKLIFVEEFICWIK